MPLPEPLSPAVLARIPPDARVFDAGSELWRVYSRGGAHPTPWNAFRAYGPTNLRFDHHHPPPHEQERAILYAAEQALTCLAEVFQDGRAIDRTSREPWLVCFPTARRLRLLDLGGLWPTRAGGSQEMNTGDRAMARRWSATIYAAYPDIDGLSYPSKMHGSARSVALYERAGNVFPPEPSFHLPLAAAELFDTLNNAARQLGYQLL